MLDSSDRGESSSVRPTPSWTGHRIDEITGGHVGRIEGLLIGESSGEPEWLLARMGRFGPYTLVPARDAVGGVGHVWVAYTRELIRKAPKVDPNQSLLAAAERRLLEHYGLAVDADRATELAARADDAVSARPVG